MNYTDRLISAFKTDTDTYHFVYQTTGGANCACGRPIKNLFIVENHEGHQVTLGSVCIDNYDSLNHVKVEIEQARIKEEQAELATLQEQAIKIAERTNALISAKIFIDRELYMLKFPDTSKLKRHSSKVNKLTRYIKEGTELLAVAEESAKEIFANREKAEAERVAKAAASNHVGEVGERIKLSGKIVRIYRGHNFKVTTLDVDGNTVATFTDIKQDEIGKELTIEAIVKEHKTFRGEKQTVVKNAVVI